MPPALKKDNGMLGAFVGSPHSLLLFMFLLLLLAYSLTLKPGHSNQAFWYPGQFQGQ